MPMLNAWAFFLTVKNAFTSVFFICRSIAFLYDLIKYLLVLR
jgi:hypothetical protein